MIEQATTRRGMMEISQPSTATEVAAHDQYRSYPQQRQLLIRQMKREAKPSRRLRIHIVLLVADGHSLSQIARVLYCSRTTIYSTAQRFVHEGEAAFADQKPRGSGALNWVTGCFHWVVGPRKNSALFVSLLNHLRQRSRCHRRLHLAVDNDGSHRSGLTALAPLTDRCPIILCSYLADLTTIFMEGGKGRVGPERVPEFAFPEPIRVEPPQGWKSELADHF